MVPRQEACRVPALALLEFTNLSRDASLDWLGVGIAETLEGELRKLSGLRIINRARTQQMIRGLHLNTEDPAHLSLWAAASTPAGLRRAVFSGPANRIRVVSSVLHVPAGELVSAGKVDGAWDDLFDVQDRVVASLTEALQLESSTHRRASAPTCRRYLPGRLRALCPRPPAPESDGPELSPARERALREGNRAGPELCAGLLRPSGPLTP